MTKAITVRVTVCCEGLVSLSGCGIMTRMWGSENEIL